MKQLKQFTFTNYALDKVERQTKSIRKPKDRNTEKKRITRTKRNYFAGKICILTNKNQPIAMVDDIVMLVQDKNLSID